MKFIAPFQTPYFHLAVERHRQSFWFKGSLQLATNTTDRGRCSLSLPPLSSLPFKRSDSHENPQRPTLPVLYPALSAAAAAALPTNTHTYTHPHPHTDMHIKHLIHTNVCSPASVRWQLPLHPSTRRRKTFERKSSVSKQLQVFSGII